VLRNRLDLARTRDDKRQWVQDRRARTRHLIELGGLVQKAGLIELTDDDRATMLGALLEIAGRLREQEDEHKGEDAGDLLRRWRRRGLRAFEGLVEDTPENDLQARLVCSAGAFGDFADDPAASLAYDPGLNLSDAEVG